MSARILLALSAAVVAATGGVAQTLPVRAEPLKAAVAAHSLRDTDLGWKVSTAGLVVHGSKAAINPVAIATRKLDLSKLTMADFGDVDSSR